MWLNYLLVFLVGGFICMLGQILSLKTKLTPTRILVIFLIIGGILEFVGVYDFLIELGRAGAQVPIIGFGATLVRGVREQVMQRGFLGIFTGGLTATAGGIGAAIFFAYLIALIFNSKSKNK